MHQTFYIDIDEEITSIVERLRNARASEIVVVVPKRALLIQSIVNLRLLKKEADNLGRSIMIVTQDKLGKLLVEKAGILVQQKMDDIGEEELTASFDDGEDERLVSGNRQNESGQTRSGDSDHLARIGSENYFEEAVTKDAQMSKQLPLKKSREVSPNSLESSEKITNKELVTNLTDDIRRKNNFSRIDSMQQETKMNVGKNLDVRNFSSTVPTGSFSKSPAYAQKENNSSEGSFLGTSGQDKKIESFFSHNEYKDRPQERKSSFIGDEKNKDEMSNANVPGKFKKVVLIFGLIFILAVIFALVYLVGPKATISITTKAKIKAADTEIKGDVNLSEIDRENEAIPAKLVSVSEEIAKTYSASGNKSVSNQKARGKVTIYNEFSSSSQSLVATTRLLSEDGKLFRLVKGVTVPGTQKSGSDVSPGEVEAEVVADESGDSFNVSSTKFSIPGFKDSGNGKYEKFYAKSKEAMTGGGNGDNSAKSLSQNDIDAAKSKIVADLQSVIREKIKQAAGSDMIVLDGAVNMEEATYKVSNSPGEVLDNFEMKAQMKAEALVVNESDVKKIVSGAIARSGNGKAGEEGVLTLDYGKSDADFKAGNIIIKVHGVSKLNPDLDIENLKKGILGKSNADLEAYLSTYPDIEKAEVSYWPLFLSQKIPMYEKRVEIIVDNNSAQ